MKVFGLISLLFFAVNATVFAGTDRSSPITLTIVNCPEQRENTPSVLISETEASGTYRLLDAPVRKDADGIFVTQFLGQSSHFWVLVRVGKCATSFPVTIVTGHARHLLAFPSQTGIAVVDAYHWIAGELPEGVGSVDLSWRSGRPYDASAIIDDGCYYFEFVGPGDYVLRFQASPGLFADVPLKIKGPESSGQFVQFTRDQLIQRLNGGAHSRVSLQAQAGRRP